MSVEFVVCLSLKELFPVVEFLMESCSEFEAEILAFRASAASPPEEPES